MTTLESNPSETIDYPESDGQPEVERRLLRLEQARLNAEVRAAEQSARADAAEAELARLRAERGSQ